MWRLVADILNKQLWSPTRSGTPAWSFGVRVATSHCKNNLCSKTSHRASELDRESPYECGIEPPGSVSHGVS